MLIHVVDWCRLSAVMGSGCFVEVEPLLSMQSLTQSVASDAKRDKAKPRCKINDRIPGTKAQGWFIAPCYAQATKALITAQLMVKDLALVRKAGHKGWDIIWNTLHGHRKCLQDRPSLLLAHFLSRPFGRLNCWQINWNTTASTFALAHTYTLKCYDIFTHPMIRILHPHVVERSLLVSSASAILTGDRLPIQVAISFTNVWIPVAPCERIRETAKNDKSRRLGWWRSVFVCDIFFRERNFLVAQKCTEQRKLQQMCSWRACYRVSSHTHRKTFQGEVPLNSNDKRSRACLWYTHTAT